MRRSEKDQLKSRHERGRKKGGVGRGAGAEMRIEANPRERGQEQEGGDLVVQAIDLRARGQTKGEAALTQAAAELMCSYVPMLEASSAASFSQ